MDINEPNQANPASTNSESFTQRNSTVNQSQNTILAQNADKAERKLKLRWVLAISCLPLFGIYAAFGIAPQTLTGTIPTAMVVEEIGLPVANDANNKTTAQNYWYKEHVRRDDTLNSVLSRLNIRNHDDIEFIRNDTIASEIATALKPGHEIESETDTDGNLVSLEYQLEADQFITIKQTADGNQATKVVHQLESRPILKSAEIKSSLFGATDDANIPDHIAIQVAEMFESDIDFHKDLRRGDHFNVIYEGSYDQGELLKTGDVFSELIGFGRLVMNDEILHNGRGQRVVFLRKIVVRFVAQNNGKRGGGELF